MTASLHKLSALIFLLDQIAVRVILDRLRVLVCDLLGQRALNGEDDHVVDLDDPTPVLVNKGGVWILNAFFVERVPVRDYDG